MTVQSILNVKGKDVVAIGPKASVHEAAKLLGQHRIGAVLVREDNGAIAGILSERDIVRAVAARGSTCLDLAIESLMTKKVETCSSGDSIIDVMTHMTEHRIRHLPVVDNGKLIGLISIGDVVKARIAEAELEANALKEYIATG